MKNLVKFILIFAALAFFAINYEANAQAVIYVHNPSTCPQWGWAGADHPVMGASTTGTFSGSLTDVHIYWDQLPGIYNTYVWARTVTVQGDESTSWDAMYCFDDDWVEIGFNYNLIAHLYLTPRLIFNPDDPQ